MVCVCALCFKYYITQLVTTVAINLMQHHSRHFALVCKVCEKQSELVREQHRAGSRSISVRLIFVLFLRLRPGYDPSCSEFQTSRNYRIECCHVYVLGIF